MSFINMFLLKNIYIVHRLHEKLTKCKRLKEGIARKFKSFRKTQNEVLRWGELCLQGVISRKKVVVRFIEQRMRSGVYQAISLASGLAVMMRIYPVSKIEEISIPKGRNFIRVRESTLRRGLSC